MQKEENETFIKLIKFNNHLLQENKILKSNTFLLLALSGGQDSIFLFFFILHLKRQWNWKLSFIWCNHLWQIESFSTMCHVFKMAYVVKLPINLVITHKFLINEEKSGIWRLVTFQRVSFFSKTTYILNGHTASDLIETAVFHLLRGSGSNSLVSSKPVILNNWQKFFPPASIMYSNFSNLFVLNNSNIEDNFFSIKIFEEKPMLPKFPRSRRDLLQLRNPKKRQKAKTCSLWDKSRRGSFASFETNLGGTKQVFPKPKKKVERNLMLFQKKKTQLEKIKIFKYFSFILYSNTHLIIVRPLGSFHRFDIQQSCLLWKMPIYPDQTNLKLYLMRNRLRNQVLPTLRFFFNSKTDRVLYQFIDIKEAEHFYFNSVVHKVLNSLEIKKQKNVTLNLKFLHTLPLAIQRRVLKFILKDYMKFSLSFYHIESILKSLFLHKKLLISDSIGCTKPFSIFLQQKISINRPKKRFQVFLYQTPEYIFIPKKGVLLFDLFLHFIQ